MIYNLNTTILIPGKMAEYIELAKETQPMFPKLGMKVAGSFHGYTGNLNAIYTLYIYDNLAAFQKSREARPKEPEFLRLSAKLSSLYVSTSTEILEPNPWSPMK